MTRVPDAGAVSAFVADAKASLDALVGRTATLTAAALAESAGARSITNDRCFARKLAEVSFDVVVF